MRMGVDKALPSDVSTFLTGREGASIKKWGDGKKLTVSYVYKGRQKGRWFAFHNAESGEKRGASKLNCSHQGGDIKRDCSWEWIVI